MRLPLPFPVLWLLFIGHLACATEDVAGVYTHTVHARALENTITGESADRRVAVYLPSSYGEPNSTRRYPMLFLLHGIGDTEKEWTRAWYDEHDPWGTVERIMNRGVAEGRLKELIIVMPDMRSNAGGSFYLNSTATGRWETFLIDELVPWVDSNFRTMSNPESRGIAGHSMGGYGAMIIGMKYPQMFSAVYAMNPAMIDWGGDLQSNHPAFRSLLNVTAWDGVAGMYEMAVMATSQAFSPNPGKPPFYADLPFATDSDGRMLPVEPAFSRWSQSLIINQIQNYLANLKTLRGFRFDAGTYDEFTHIPLTSRRLSRFLRDLDVPHVFEEYNGGHRNRMWGETGRLHTEVLPWFSLLLKDDALSP